MNQRFALHIPTMNELWYRQKLMQDPETMSYNKDYDLELDGYHKATGCIDFPKEDWQDWFEYFIGQEPDRFYAYIVRLENGEWIGEVNIHKSGTESWYEMGIVLEAKYRGRGYAVESLKLLLSYAFDNLNAVAVHNDFEDSRDAAIATHLKAGFKEYRRANGFLELLITREDWNRLSDDQ